MLTRITENCDMGCSHCMINAGPDGKHMSMETYNDVLRFIEKIGLPVILLSGGEPTRHPEILPIIDAAKERKIHIILISNGTFLEKPDLKKAILERNIPVQITNDPRFYPRKIPIINDPNLVYEDTLRLISPFHRAITNHLDISRASPLCFNIRSACNHYRDFFKAVQFLRMSVHKMCIPSINIDGTLAAGESNFCSVFGHVTDSNIKLTNKLISLKCGKCGLYKNLDSNALKAIGELAER